MVTLQHLICWTLLTTAASACSLQLSNINIPDYTPVGTVIIPVLVSAPDTPDADASNSDPSNSGMPLQVLANNSLILSAPITKSGLFQVTCLGSTGAKPSLIAKMVDTDNNAPVWEKLNYTESVIETQSVPYLLQVKPKATDEPDKDSGQRLEYSILSSPYSNYFNLTDPRQSVMVIYLITQLDYETVQQVVLTLQVSDFNSSGQKVFEVNATLTVNVINVDDVNPVWLNCTVGAPSGVCYVRQLISNGTTGTLVEPPLKAVDGDLGLNAVIFYSIVSQSPKNILAVNNATGALSLTTNLPTPQKYTFVLFATQANDANKKTDTILILNIIPASYSPPVFDQSVYNVTVVENNPPGLVIVVKATDQLRTGVTYGLQNFLDVFTIVASSGELKTIVSLNYESKSAYALNVSATDGTGFGFATVMVEVGNVNEFNPAFDRTEYTFAAARRENGFEVGRVNASDGDGTPVTYFITDADFRKLFAVDPTLGTVTINTVPANLVEQSYRFSVTASDASRTSSATVIVSFDSALISVANASVTTIPLIVLGCVFAVIIISVIVAFVLYRRNAAAKAANQSPEEDGSEVPGSYAYGDLYEMGSTSQQENPVEGYNNYMFGDDGGPDVGSFNRERDQGELFVSNGFYPPASANDFSSLTNGSIHTADNSLVGSQRTLVHGSRPRQLHAGSNLQVVQVENAVDASSDLPAGDRQGGRVGPGLTVYF